MSWPVLKSDATKAVLHCSGSLNTCSASCGCCETKFSTKCRISPNKKSFIGEASDELLLSGLAVVHWASPVSDAPIDILQVYATRKYKTMKPPFNISGGTIEHWISFEMFVGLKFFKWNYTLKTQCKAYYCYFKLPYLTVFMSIAMFA